MTTEHTVAEVLVEEKKGMTIKDARATKIEQDILNKMLIGGCAFDHIGEDNFSERLQKHPHFNPCKN